MTFPLGVLFFKMLNMRHLSWYNQPQSEYDFCHLKITPMVRYYAQRHTLHLNDKGYLGRRSCKNSSSKLSYISEIPNSKVQTPLDCPKLQSLTDITIQSLWWVTWNDWMVFLLYYGLSPSHPDCNQFIKCSTTKIKTVSHLWNGQKKVL